MENLSTLEIIGIVILVLIFGGVIWRIAKRLFVIALIAALILLGIYHTKPEILYDWFGKDNVHKVEGEVKEGVEAAQKETQEFTDEVLDN